MDVFVTNRKGTSVSGGLRHVRLVETGSEQNAHVIIHILYR